VSDVNRERAFWRSIPRDRPVEIPRPRSGQESVWDFPRPPRVEACAARIRVFFAGITIADTRAALRVLETAGAPTYYIPHSDLKTNFLRPPRNETTSLCEWKGVAQYRDLQVGPRRCARVAWYYPEPDEVYRALTDHSAFFAGRGARCWVGGELARPQPGGFYGGWVSDAILGPFKGEPGTESW
jgi:uncharacterized protein (DUF427 family)